MLLYVSLSCHWLSFFVFIRLHEQNKIWLFGSIMSRGPVEWRMCNKKVTQKENGDWTCAGGHVSAYPEFRYLCRMNILDHTDAQQKGMALGLGGSSQKKWSCNRKYGNKLSMQHLYVVKCCFIFSSRARQDVGRQLNWQDAIHSRFLCQTRISWRWTSTTRLAGGSGWWFYMVAEFLTHILKWGWQMISLTSLGCLVLRV